MLYMWYVYMYATQCQLGKDTQKRSPESFVFQAENHPATAIPEFHESIGTTQRDLCIGAGSSSGKRSIPKNQGDSSWMLVHLYSSISESSWNLCLSVFLSVIKNQLQQLQPNKPTLRCVPESTALPRGPGLQSTWSWATLAVAILLGGSSVRWVNRFDQILCTITGWWFGPFFIFT